MWSFITVVASKVPANLRSIWLQKLLVGKVYLILFVLWLLFFKLFFRVFRSSLLLLRWSLLSAGFRSVSCQVGSMMA